VAVDLIVHRGQEFFSRAAAADQGIQPGESGAVTAHPRLSPLGRLTCCHTMSSFCHSNDYVTGRGTEDSGKCLSLSFYSLLYG
jgi:hypothetical protein